MKTETVKTSIVAALAALLTVKPATPRYTLTDERLATLRKIHGNEAAFLRLVHNFAGAPTERVKNAVEYAIRKWVPEELEEKWTARDARKVHNQSRTKRAPFNPIRVNA